MPTIFALILLISVAQPFLWSLSFIMPSALRAAGDSKFTSVVSMLTMVAEWGVGGIVYMRFRGDKWYKHKQI